MLEPNFILDIKDIVNSLCLGLKDRYIAVEMIYSNPVPYPCDMLSIKKSNDSNENDGEIVHLSDLSDTIYRDLVIAAMKFLDEDSDDELEDNLNKLKAILHQVEACREKSDNGCNYPFSDFEKDSDLLDRFSALLEELFRVILQTLMQKEENVNNGLVLVSEVVKNKSNKFQVLGLIIDKKAIEDEHLPIISEFSDDNSFIQSVINVIFQKWCDVFKYSLKYSDSEYIMDLDAVIRLAARDSTEGRNLPSYKILEAISGTRYENAECHGAVAFFPGIDPKECIPFGNEIGFSLENVRYIRKLLEMTSWSEKKSFVLCVDTRSPMAPKVVGLIKKEKCKSVYTVEFRGFLKWTLKKDYQEIFSCDAGKYSYNKNRLGKYDIQLQKLLNCSDSQINDIHFIVETIWKQHHGTMLVLFNDPMQAEKEAKRLIRMGRGISLNAYDLCAADEKKELILSLTSIDGALFMDINSKIYGFGIIVDGEAIAEGSTERGARYNSAKNYIAVSNKNDINNVALVVSEDRTVDLISN